MLAPVANRLHPIAQQTVDEEKPIVGLATCAKRLDSKVDNNDQANREYDPFHQDTTWRVGNRLWDRSVRPAIISLCACVLWVNDTFSKMVDGEAHAHTWAFMVHNYDRDAAFADCLHWTQSRD